jgi:hypothetical protein
MPVTFTLTSPYHGAVEMPAARFAPRLQLAEANAVRILDILGFGDDSNHDGPTARAVPASGRCDAVDFLGRILLAIALTNPRGYTLDRLTQLQALAQHAIAYGDLITWTD